MKKSALIILALFALGGLAKADGGSLPDSTSRTRFKFRCSTQQTDLFPYELQAIIDWSGDSQIGTGHFVFLRLQEPAPVIIRNFQSDVKLVDDGVSQKIVQAGDDGSIALDITWRSDFASDVPIYDQLKLDGHTFNFVHCDVE